MTYDPSCPLCSDPPGVHRGHYGCSPEYWAVLRERHDAGHPNPNAGSVVLAVDPSWSTPEQAEP